MDRRGFLTSVITGGAAMTTMSLQNNKERYQKITILHTNDTHSHIDQFSSNHIRHANQGGIQARKFLLDKIRKEEKHVLLLDAGDIFQGTPYFNMFGGELELKLMSRLKYDAATIGNHDFDGGIDGLHSALPNANFPFISSNYDFSDTIMNHKTIPFKIFRKGRMKIGVFGIGVELDGLVSPSLYKNTIYSDPVQKSNEYASKLKNDYKCDLVICLSHLGYKMDGQIDDHKLAKKTKNIDLIIGGHTHTFLKKPDMVQNNEGKMVLINQAGWAGLLMGRVDFYLSENNKSEVWGSSNISTNINIS